MFGANKAKKILAVNMPKVLHRLFGVSESYTEAQVRKAFNELSLNKRYINLALALYCVQHEFGGIDGEGIERIDRDSFVAEYGVGNLQHFKPQVDFDKDAVSLAESVGIPVKDSIDF